MRIPLRSNSGPQKLYGKNAGIAKPVGHYSGPIDQWVLKANTLARSYGFEHFKESKQRLTTVRGVNLDTGYGSSNCTLQLYSFALRRGQPEATSEDTADCWPAQYLKYLVLESESTLKRTSGLLTSMCWKVSCGKADEDPTGERLAKCLSRWFAV